jgi:MtN3 and saliva related transmembrane protein
MNIEEIIGIGAGVCTASSLLPQVIKTIKTKEAEEVSIGMLLILLAGLILWIVYGWMKKDIPILATNCFSLLLNVVMLFLRIRYGRGGR